MANNFYINGTNADLMGLSFMQGTNRELNKPAKAKIPSIQHNWPDQHGTQVDASPVFLESRNLSLPMLLVGNSESDYLLKLTAFNTFLKSARYFTIGSQALNRVFTLRFVECTDWQDDEFSATFNFQVIDDYPHLITPLVV